MNNIPKPSLNTNKYSEDIMLLDRFLDKCFARNTFLGNDENESRRLDIYIDELTSKDISTLRDVQKNTIKKIGSMMMGISGDEFDEYRENHTGGESYDSVNEWYKLRNNQYFIHGILILKNKKLMSGSNYSFGKAPGSKNTSLLNDKITDDFNALYIKNSKNVSMGVQTLDDNFVNIFSKYDNFGLQNFYKILFLANHDASFHNIDTFEEENKNNKEIVEVVCIEKYKKDAYDSENYKKGESYDSYESSIKGLGEGEYSSLKEHQTHFTNAYKSNPEFEKYIYDTFKNFICKLEEIASKLDNNGGCMIDENTNICGKVFMQYMLQYILTFFGRIWSIYEDKYIVGLMNRYDVKLLPLHDKIIKGVWSNDHHFKLANGKEINHQEFYKIATYNN